MSDHKAIREAAEEGPYYTAMVAKDDLRALLAGLDGMRGALKYARRFLNAQDHDVAFIDTALKGASHD